MKGIYLTAEGKKEIEAKIAELEDVKQKNNPHDFEWNESDIKQNIYKEILYSATILPVEDNWDEIRLLDGIDSSGTGNLTKAKYPNGVIIEPKT
jgi:hypothetical protein